MKKLILFLIILFLFTDVNSQKKINLSRQDSAIIKEYIYASEQQDSMKNNRNSSEYLNKIAMTYWNHNHLEKAEKYYKKSLKRNENIQNENGIAMINSNLALIYSDMSEYEKALKYFEKTYLIRKTAKEKIGIISALINMSIVLNNLKKFEKSAEKIEEALDIAREINDTKQMCSCYGQLSETYDKMGNSEKSLHYFNLYKSFHEMNQKIVIQKSKEELENEKLRTQLAETKSQKKELELIKKKYELKEKNEELEKSNNEINNLIENLSKKEMATEIIKKESKIKEMQAKQKIKSRENIIIWITMSACFIIVITLILLRAYRQKRKTNFRLESQNAEIKQQNEEILQQKEELQVQATILHKTNTKLQELDKMKQGLTGMLVHDLKNPLGSIINSSEKKEIVNAGTQMLHLVSNILDVQKYENTEIPLEKRNYLLSEILDNVVSQVNYLARYKNITLINNVKETHYLKIDKEITIRIFVNLLTNAIKYSFVNKKITIDINNNKSNDDFLFVEIIDNGIGISPEKIDIVFDKFAQVNARSSGDIRSTGLGLTFCKMAVEAHGGKIFAESVPAEKTVFGFSLPKGKEVKTKSRLDIKQEIQEEKIILNKNEIDYLKTYIDEFKKYDVFEILSIQNINNNIDDNFSEQIKKWKDKMSDAIYYCNDELYNKLIQI